MSLKFLTNSLRCLVVSPLIVAGVLSAGPRVASGAELPTGRVYPPRAYFTQANLNKNGVVSAIQGEDNFIRIFLPAIDTSGHPIPPDALNCTLLLPEGVSMLPEPNLPLDIKKVTVGDSPAQEVSFTVPPDEVQKYCLQTENGLELVLWCRVDALRAGESYPIQLALKLQDQTCFTDNAKLYVYGKLPAITPVNADSFRLWLHYGPLYRKNQWDALATMLQHIGINTVQVMSWNTEMAQAMKQRGFYVIAQRTGSYSDSYEPGTAVTGAVEQGRDWFQKNDAGQMETILPFADAVLWDFEPSPQYIVTDDATLKQFREFAKIPPTEKLDEETIKTKHMKQWVTFRQRQFAALAKNWAGWNQSLKKDVKTILTEGRCNVFDPRGQVDYRNVDGSITYFDPMNFSGSGAIRGMRQWQNAVPDGKFLGCQNVAFSPQSPVTVSPDTVMMQIVSDAFLGNEGTSIYPGQTMDAENFVRFNRVMGFLGKNQEILWKGDVHPKEMILTPLPKQDETITLGTGDTLRNVYPDWSNDAVVQTYKSKSGDTYFAGIVNWNTNEPCYAKIQIEGLSGKWMLTDDESHRVYTYGGKVRLDAAELARGVVVSVPSSDYRGFRVAHFDADAAKDYQQVALEDTAKEFSRYADASGTEKKAGDQTGAVRLDYDDIDGDKILEYRVTTASQKVWINQAGCVVRWQAGGASLDGILGRDKIWIPASERDNASLDGAMKLESRKSDKDHAEIVLSRTIALSSVGSMVDLRMTKKYTISNQRAEIAVETTIQNNSLSMQNSSFELSYRVHNLLKYDGAMTVWTDDGAALATLGSLRDSSIPSAGLGANLSEQVFANYTKLPERKLMAFGDYRPKEKTFLAFVPNRADDLLQMLRWLSEDSREGTIEWMYRPVKLASGQSWKAAYRMDLAGNVTNLNHSLLEKVCSPSEKQP